MKRHLVTILSVVSLVLCASTLLLWVRTELMQRTDTLVWGEAGVYCSIELSSDDLKYRILRDPGFPSRRLQWHNRRGGWLTPPAPSNPLALPSTSVIWVLPPPRSQFLARETRSVWLPKLGFDYAEFSGWYGPGTILFSYRLSYFAVMLPAAILPLWWTIRRLVHWRRHRHTPGYCRTCGYDLRASTERCPECGSPVPAGHTLKASP